MLRVTHTAVDWKRIPWDSIIKFITSTTHQVSSAGIFVLLAAASAYVNIISIRHLLLPERERARERERETARERGRARE